MSGFLEFLFPIIFFSDKSAPIERTRKGFIQLAFVALICTGAVFGLIAVIFHHSYVLGFFLLLASIVIYFVWYHVYKRFYKGS